jgi:YVTN family beta-propeller protein
MQYSRAMGIIGLIGQGVLLGLSSGAAAAATSPAQDWAVVQRWKLGGVGGWDYMTLDAAGQRLFLTRSDHVDVVNTDSGKIIGTIPNTQGVHGIALDEESNRGYTSNGRADSVTVFDLASLKVVKESPVSGHNPDAILYEPTGKHVFTFNGKSKDVTVLDATSLAVVATLPVPDKPEFAVDDGAGQIFVNIESEPGQMVVIDSRHLTIKATWQLPGCNSPSGLALDRTHRRLFSVCDDKVMAVTDADTGKQVAKVKIGEGPDAVAFDAKRGLVFSSNGEGTLSVVKQESPAHYTVVTSVATQAGARTMALDSAHGKVYTVSADLGPPPAATPERPHPRPTPLPDTFTVLVVSKP